MHCSMEIDARSVRSEVEISALTVQHLMSLPVELSNRCCESLQTVGASKTCDDSPEIFTPMQPGLFMLCGGISLPRHQIPVATEMQQSLYREHRRLLPHAPTSGASSGRNANAFLLRFC